MVTTQARFARFYKYKLEFTFVKPIQLVKSKMLDMELSMSKVLKFRAFEF
jgi:hypothetical protein